MLRAARIPRSQRCDRAARRSKFPEALLAARCPPRHCRLSCVDFASGDTPNSYSESNLSPLSPKTRQATQRDRNQPATAWRQRRAIAKWLRPKHFGMVSPKQRFATPLARGDKHSTVQAVQQILRWLAAIVARRSRWRRRPAAVRSTVRESSPPPRCRPGR